MGCLSLKLFPQLASRLSDSLFPTKSHERTVEQTREEVELDVDVVHVERPSSRIAQRDGVLQAVGPAPVEGVIFLPHLTVVVAKQRFFALPAGIEDNLVVDQRTVFQRIVGLSGVAAQLPRGGSAAFGIVTFADGAAAPGNQQGEEAEEEGQVSFTFFHVIVSLRLDIANRYLIFTPQLVYVAVLSQDVLHRSVERPGNDLQRTPVELAQEFGVFVVAQPHEEVAGRAIPVHVAAAFRSCTGAFEASVGYPHGVCHALDEGAERRAVSVAAHSLRLQLVGVCQFVEQYAAGFEQYLGRIVLAERLFDVTGAVEDADVTVSAAFGRNTFGVFQRIVYLIDTGDAVFGRRVEGGQHGAGLFLDVAFGPGDDAAVDIRPGGFGSLVLEQDTSYVVTVPYGGRLVRLWIVIGGAGCRVGKQAGCAYE